jgi:hypothetical protein
MNRLELSNLEFSHTLMHQVENPREGGQVAQIFEKNQGGWECFLVQISMGVSLHFH